MDDSLLCELVGQHPGLYDPKNRHYKNQHIKDNVWKETAATLKQSGKQTMIFKSNLSS